MTTMGKQFTKNSIKLWGAKSEKTLPLLEVKDTTELKANLEKAKSEITRIENEKAAEEKELAKREDEFKTRAK